MTPSDLEAVQRAADMHAVYRMYNPNRQLLYVGVTGNVASRLTRHADKRWYPLVSTIKLEWFPSRDLAEAAEAKAIRDERPQINIAGVPSEIRNARVARPPRIPRPSPPLSGRVTLAEAVETGVFGSRSLAAVRKAMQRTANPPEPDGMRGCAHEYEIGKLYALAKESTR
jgi:predicted GIY-YIG superfamily endonuclease